MPDHQPGDLMISPPFPAEHHENGGDFDRSIVSSIQRPGA
jgi:hypothetical protein